MAAVNFVRNNTTMAMAKIYKPRNFRPKCYVCDQQIQISGKDVFTSYTDHTKTSIRDLLGQFVGHELIRTSETSLGCEQCINRINEYDLASYTAKHAQAELTELLNATEEKYFQKVVFLCDDVKEEDIIDEDDIPPENIKEEIDVSLQKLQSLEEDTDEYELHFFSPEVGATSRECENSEQVDNSEVFIYKTVFCDMLDDDVKDSANDDELFLQSDTSELDSSGAKGTKKQPNFCRVCSMQFDCKETLREHRNAVHPPSAERLICDICGMTYKTRAALQVHVAMHQGISPHECNICHKKFTQKGALKRHQPIHTGVRPYQCEKCGKQFIHYSSFHMHNLAHADVRDKKCDICGLMLRSTSHLNRHMLVHTGVKPHTCPKCGKSFAQRYNMTSHLRSHQGIQRKRKHVCPNCHRGFARESLLQSHITSSICSPDESNIIAAYEKIEQADD